MASLPAFPRAAAEHSHQYYAKVWVHAIGVNVQSGRPYVILEDMSESGKSDLRIRYLDEYYHIVFEGNPPG